MAMTLEQYRAEFQAMLDAGEKELLRAEYIALIGYDPFEDDPTLSLSVVRDVLADYKRTFVDADTDASNYPGWHSMQSAARDNY
jgi:hypothetical protein